MRLRLDVNYKKKKTIKNTNIWRLNNSLLNNQQITEEIKICIETNENENTSIYLINEENFREVFGV